MKKILPIIAFLIISSQSLLAQELFVKSYFENTNTGLKAGTVAGVFIKPSPTCTEYKGFGFGAFYQQTTDPITDEEAKFLRYERSFAGLFLQTQLYVDNQATIDFNVRTGIQNGENFLISPSLSAGYYLGSHIEVGCGMGTRGFTPTYLGYLKLSF